MNKKMVVLMISLITVFMVAAGSFTAFADCRWDTDNNGIRASWDQLSSKGRIYLYKGKAYKVGDRVTVSKDTTSYDFSQRIKDMGPGTYHFTITDDAGRTWESENLQVDENMFDAIGTYTWVKEGVSWRLYDFKGTVMTGWQQVDGKWYYLDPGTGKCLMNTVTPDGYRVDETGAWDGQAACR